MKKGKILLIETLPPSLAPSLLILMNARARVIGMMASVLVSFTVTALSSVALPRFHMLSHVEAHAVTEDVSFTAVPANIPNGVPSVVLNPMALPRMGNMIAASTLKRNITDTDCATAILKIWG